MCGGVTTVEYAWSSRHAEVCGVTTVEYAWSSRHAEVCGVTTVEYAWSSRHAEVWRSNHSRVCMVKQACRGVAE